MILPAIEVVLRTQPSSWSVLQGDSREVLKEIPDGVADAFITDPIYPEVDREGGRMSVGDWKPMMVDVVREARRILKPSGSAVFVIQPNSERIGRLRSWAFEFMAWIAKEWNLIQDVWWWNYAAMPTLHSSRKHGLLRPSVKACVWAGAPDCYRCQDEILWERSEATINDKRINRSQVDYKPSGHHQRQDRALRVSLERGGSTPYNVIPCANTDSSASSGAKGHGSGTPSNLADWWVRYICPPGGLVVDPFCGAGTIGKAALRNERRFIGIDVNPVYVELARGTCENALVDEPPGQPDRSDSEDLVRDEASDVSGDLWRQLDLLGNIESEGAGALSDGREEATEYDSGDDETGAEGNFPSS